MTRKTSRPGRAGLWRCAVGITAAIMVTFIFSGVCAAGGTQSPRPVGEGQGEGSLMQALHAGADSAQAASDAPGHRNDAPGLSDPPGQSGEQHGQGYLHRTEPRSKAKGKAWGPGGKKKKNKKLGGGPDEPVTDIAQVMSVPVDQLGEPTPVPEPGSLVVLSGGLLGLAGIATRRRR